jgi:hypothetical protein
MPHRCNFGGKFSGKTTVAMNNKMTFLDSQFKNNQKLINQKKYENL